MSRAAQVDATICLNAELHDTTLDAFSAKLIANDGKDATTVNNALAAAKAYTTHQPGDDATKEIDELRLTEYFRAVDVTWTDNQVPRACSHYLRSLIASAQITLWQEADALSPTIGTCMNAAGHKLTPEPVTFPTITQYLELPTTSCSLDLASGKVDHGTLACSTPART